MKIKQMLSCLPLVALLFACDNGLIDQPEENLKSEVSFTSSISLKQQSRAVNASWEANDKIGVYMLSNSSKQILNSNACYVTQNGNGDFLASNSTLYYPADGSYVDFLAYYPYQSGQISSTYKVNVADQSKPENIDLLYSNNLTERNNASVQGNLQFYHQLSRLTIHFSSTDNSDINAITANVNGIYTQADFDLSTGKLTVDQNQKSSVKMYRSGSVAQAILLPTAEVKGISIAFTLNGTTKEITLPASITSLQGGTNYSFNVNVKNGASIVVPGDVKYARWTETPIITKEQLEKKNIHYINHYMPNDTKVRNYSMLYDSDLKISYWVAYPYCPYYKGGQKRTDDWSFDPAVSPSLQADLHSGFGGIYDRGHQIPSGDRTKDRGSNAATFYYTNMTPQVGRNMNQSIWVDLENQVRAWSTGTDTIFVVTGASPTSTASSNDISYVNKSGTKVAIPKYYYKALARKVGGQFRTIAFKLDNVDFHDRDYMKRAISVAELEKLTGFTFFPSISTSIKENLDKSYWN